MVATPPPRRKVLGAMLMMAAFGTGLPVLVRLANAAEEEGDKELLRRFEHLSRNGNSNCSRQFMESIPKMPVTARIQGSCCSPMDAHRYVEQVKGLRKYEAISAIPPDPYDIPAGLAATLMGQYERPLSPVQQARYDYAMENSNERGPCCCQCWRWHVYGGLAKQLIAEHDFSGRQISEIWDLSDGCGGGDHLHL